nr:immunoglobulin light chain junction region [Macaca mulatta]
CMQGKQLPRTF